MRDMESSLGISDTRLTDLLLDAVCVVDAEGKFRFVSAAGERIFGYAPQEMVGMAVLDLVLPADRERTRAAAQAVMDGRSHLAFENRYVRKDGSVVHVMWSARWYASEGIRVGVARDVTQFKRAQAMQAALYAMSEAANASVDLSELFRRSHAIAAGLLPVSALAIVLQEQGQAAPRLAYHAGDPGQEACLLALCDRVWREGDAAVQRDSCASLVGVPLSAGESRLGVLALARACGGEYDAEERELLAYIAGQLGAAVQRRELQSRMKFMAMHDELTRLPNRRLFHDRLQTALARAQRQDSRVALLFIDLNRFKQVNDTHGHLAGDRLLEQVARRLASCIRDADTLARLGGDEFVVLLENIASRTDADIVADKIGLALAAPFELGDGLVLAITASIGIACRPEHGDSMQALMARADKDMYRAKHGAAPCAAS